MLPAVESAEPGALETRTDRRKDTAVGWKQARLTLAPTPGSVTLIFGASLAVEEAGEQLGGLCPAGRGGQPTRIHGVGDGEVSGKHRLCSGQYQVIVHPFQDALAHLRQFDVSAIIKPDLAVLRASQLAIAWQQVVPYFLHTARRS